MFSKRISGVKIDLRLYTSQVHRPPKIREAASELRLTPKPQRDREEKPPPRPDVEALAMARDDICSVQATAAAGRGPLVATRKGTLQRAPFSKANLTLPVAVGS